MSLPSCRLPHPPCSPTWHNALLHLHASAIGGRAGEGDGPRPAGQGQGGMESVGNCSTPAQKHADALSELVPAHATAADRGTACSNTAWAAHQNTEFAQAKSSKLGACATPDCAASCAAAGASRFHASCSAFWRSLREQHGEGATRQPPALLANGFGARNASGRSPSNDTGPVGSMPAAAPPSAAHRVALCSVVPRSHCRSSSEK